MNQETAKLKAILSIFKKKKSIVKYGKVSESISQPHDFGIMITGSSSVYNFHPLKGIKSYT